LLLLLLFVAADKFNGVFMVDHTIISLTEVEIMTTERREDGKGNSDMEEDSLQQQQDKVKKIARLLQLGLSEIDIRESYIQAMPSEETFEKARSEFTKLDKEYRENKELPRQDLARSKQNNEEALASFDRIARDKKNMTSQERKIHEKFRTQVVEELQDTSEAQEKFPDKPYEALLEVNERRESRTRAEQPDRFANEVDRLLGNIVKRRSERNAEGRDI
jgi:hypothetical protein